MRGVTGRYKRYVEVVCETRPDGTEVPRRIIWDDARAFDVDEVLDVRWAASRKVSGTGLRHTVRVRGEATYLFREGDRWFCEAKELVL